MLVYSPSVVKLQDSKVPLVDLLPQDLLVDILTERFQVTRLFFQLRSVTVEVLMRQLCRFHDMVSSCSQQSDCSRGLVIEGLASAFTSSATATLQTVLKALKAYKHIYAVNVHDTYDAVRARETARRQAEGKKKNRPSHRRASLRVMHVVVVVSL